MTSTAIPDSRQIHQSSLPSSPSAATRPETRSYASNVVWVNVYDITFHNDYLLPLLGVGVFHSSIEVYAIEFGFGRSATGPGVFAIEPQSYPHHAYRASYALGTTNLTRNECFELHRAMLRLWPGKGYHLTKRNCNHYSHEFGKILVMAQDGNMAREWVKNYTDRMVNEGEEEYNNKNDNNNSRKKFKNIAEAKESRFFATERWASIVPSTYCWDSQEASQIVPNITEATFGGGIPLFKLLKSAFFGSSSSSMKLSYDEIFPLWINRIVRVGNRILSKNLVRKIENADRAAIGMNELTEEDEE